MKILKKTLETKFLSASLNNRFNAKNMNCVRYFLESLTLFRIIATSDGIACNVTYWRGR